MDRRTLLSASLAALALAGTARAAAPAPTILSSGGPGRYAAALDAIQAYMEQHRRDYGLPGLVLSVADGEGFAAVLSCGSSELESHSQTDPAQLYQIGSISKSVAALAAFRLAEAGKFDLDAPVKRLLPDLPLPDQPVITFRHLLHHTAGLPDDAPFFPRSPNGRLWIANPPGQAWSYSNLGYRMLGLAMSRATGQPVGEILQAQVLAPLGMTQSRGAIVAADRPRYAGGYSPYYTDRPYPQAGRLAQAQWVDMVEAAGCVASTAGDMSRYLAWLIAASNGKGGPLLSGASAKRFFEDSAPAPGWAEGARYANGLAIVQVKGRTLLHHTGGMTNFSSALHVDPKSGVGAFASTNVGGTGYRPRDITAHACALMTAARDGTAPSAPAPTRPRFAKPELFVGHYFGTDGRSFEIAAEGEGGVALRMGGGTDVLEPAGADQALSHLPGLDHYTLVAERAGDRVAALWWGPVRFAAGAAGPAPKIPPEFAARAGDYVNDSPWLGLMQVMARPDGLYLFGSRKLEALPDGSWRPMDDGSPSPERIWFDAPVAGRTGRMSYSGADFVRQS